MISKYYKITVIGIISIIPLLFYNQMMWGYYIPKNLFLQVSVFLLLLLQLGKPVTHFQFNLIDLAISAPVLLSIILSTVNGETYDFIGRLSAPLYLLLFYYLIQMIDSEGSGEGLMKTIDNSFLLISLTGLLMAVYGILQYYNLDIFHPEKFTPFGPKVVGTMGHANAFGGYLAAIFPFILFNVITLENRKLKIVYSIICSLIIWALLLTISRGAWLALVGSLLIIHYPKLRSIWRLYLRRSIYRLVGIVTILTCMLILFWGIFKINPESVHGRLFIWRITWNMVSDHPIAGIGYDRFKTEYLNYQAKFFDNPANADYFDRAANLKQVDNEYLQVLAEIGFFGFLVFLFILIIFYIAIYRILRHEGTYGEKEKWTFRAIALSITVIAIHSLVDNPLRNIPTQLLFYFAIGMVSLKVKILGILPNLNMFKVSFRFSPFILVLGIGLLAYNSYSVIHKGSGYIHWWNGQMFVREGLWQKGIQEYEKANDILSDEGELQFHLGAAYAYTQQPKKALDYLKLSQANFNDKNIYITQGEALLQLERYGEAEQSFKTALRMYPKLMLPRLWLAEMYLKLDRNKKARTELREIIAIQPKVMTGEIRRIKQNARRLLEMSGEYENN